MVLQAEKGAFESGQLAGSDLKDALPKAAEDLNPVRVRELLRAIPPSDLALLDMSAVHGRCGKNRIGPGSRNRAREKKTRDSKKKTRDSKKENERQQKVGRERETQRPVRA
eukprot:scaffold9363_cov87-Isochrysis_galbana.AAC.1